MTSMGDPNLTLPTMWFLQSFPVVAESLENIKISIISKDKVGVWHHFSG